MTSISSRWRSRTSPLTFAAIFRTRSEKVMFVKGDADLQFDSIAEVIAFAHEADIFDIGILTPKVEKGE